MGSSSLMWILSSYGETIIVWHWIEFCSGVCLWANHWFLYPSEVCLLNLVWKKIRFALYEDSDGDDRKSLLNWRSDLINRIHSVFKIWWNDHIIAQRWCIIERGWIGHAIAQVKHILPLSRQTKDKWEQDETVWWVGCLGLAKVCFAWL